MAVRPLRVRCRLTEFNPTQEAREKAGAAIYAMGNWSLVKFAQDNNDTKLYRDICGDNYERLTNQLRMDIWHSSLLFRLLCDQAPEIRGPLPKGWWK